MTDYLLTVGMPVYNDVLFIEESIQSILKQTFKNYLLVIIDDCSTDGSGEICKKYADKYEHIVYFRNKENVGISKNMLALLEHAKTPYFSWAGDDDLLHREFYEQLITLLEENPEAVSAFCTYSTIDEEGVTLETIDANYKSNTSMSRIKKLAKIENDGFGYGLFKTEKIKSTNFPTWWWPNKESAYNNIYPSLCFYLASGPYLHAEENMFWKRIKTDKNVHHKITGAGNAIKETLAYMLRRFNLVVVSTRMIRKGSNFSVAFCSFFILFRYWFLKSSWKQICLAANAFWTNRILKKKSP